MLTPLDPETVATIREHYADLELTWVDDGVACATTIAELCDSHEALRARLQEALRVIEKSHLMIEAANRKIIEARIERDARERERDEARADFHREFALRIADREGGVTP